MTTVSIRAADAQTDAALQRRFGPRVQRHVPLAPLTTFRVGGAAAWFLETSTTDDVARAMAAGRELGVPITLLGGGSNVLVGDGGIDGLVVRMRHGAVSMMPAGTVRADAGVTINQLVRWTVARGWAGLETWAGTPGTVGGALHGNAHFSNRVIGDLVSEVGVVGTDGACRRVTRDAMRFDDEGGRLNATGEAVLWAEFNVVAGDPRDLRRAARASLRYRKDTQPLASPSAGCIFRNPRGAGDDVPEGLPDSAGALIDRAGLKGRTVGHATVSPVHGNFVVTDGAATALEIRQLIEMCRSTVEARFGVRLRDEIIYLGRF